LHANNLSQQFSALFNMTTEPAWRLSDGAETCSRFFAIY